MVSCAFLTFTLIGWVFSLDVTNAFNSMSRGIIFLKLHVAGGDIIQFIPFVHAFQSPLFYSHCIHKGDVTIIPSPMGTRQGDPLGGTLFVLCFIASRSSSCLFPYLL